jgi:hypothetical protein
MSLKSAAPAPIVRCLSAILLIDAIVTPGTAHAQIWKRVTQVAACGGGAFAGVKIGEKMAEIEARKLKLGPEEAAKHRKAFQIGMALALCGGGAAIAGTTYSKLSKRGKEARERELMAALEDAQPRTYTDPERPTLMGRVSAQPAVAEGDEECRLVEDYLADGAQGDQALVKYCRPLGGGNWAVKNL